MSFSIAGLDFFLCIISRISGFVFTAPFFSIRNVPTRAKILLSVGVSIILYNIMPTVMISTAGVIEYAILIIKEAIVGMILGLFGNLAFYILSMAGQNIDMEIGLSNIQEFDPTSSMSFTITSTFLNYAVSLMLIVTDMHLFILTAAIDSFELIPVGGIKLSGDIFSVMLKYIADYMIISFRIILPVFASILIVNTVLAVLAKAAPQMNMFVIGFQLKIFVGLTVLIIMMLFLRSISDMIFNKMMEYMRNAIPYMNGGI